MAKVGDQLDAQPEAQLVTRHNRPVAVVLSVGEYRRLKALEERTLPSFRRAASGLAPG